MPGLSHATQSQSFAESYEINSYSLDQAGDSLDHLVSTATTSFADPLILGTNSSNNDIYQEKRSTVGFENQQETGDIQPRERSVLVDTKKVEELEDQIRIEQLTEYNNGKLDSSMISGLLQGNGSRETLTTFSKQLQAHELENQQGERYNQLKVKESSDSQLEPNQQRVKYVQDQQGIKNIQERMRSYLPPEMLSTYENGDRKRIEYIQEKMASNEPLDMFPAYEYENQQEIEYVRGKQRSHDPPKVLPANKYEIDPGMVTYMEYFEEKRKSRPKPLPRQEHAIPKGMEYVPEKKGSQPRVLPRQEHEIHQGIEHVREKKGSQPRALSRQEHEIHQGIEHVQEKMRSQPRALSRQEDEIHQGREYVRENKGSRPRELPTKNMRFARE